MISRKIMQDTLEGIAGIANLPLAVYDTEGGGVASSGMALPPEAEIPPEEIAAFARSSADMQQIRDELLYKIYDGERPEYVLGVQGTGEQAHMVGRLAAFQIAGLVAAYRERFDKDNFFKNLLLDNLLYVDIISRAKKLHIAEAQERICFVIRSETEWDTGRMETVRREAADPACEHVTQIDEKDVVLILGVAAGEDAAVTEECKAYADGLFGRLTQAGLTDLRISAGTVAKRLKELSRSYKEADMALDVSRIFRGEEQIICYSELGIGRLIYQMPLPLCRMFLAETFGNFDPDNIEEEETQAAEAFFENSLNVSETARKLFIHRNTLVYRLDKLQKLTGLDIRVFEDAMTYRIARMVVRYMKYMEAFDQPN